jgi:hypothetical protein
MCAARRMSIAIVLLAAACHDITRPTIVYGPGCTLKAPFSNTDMWGTVDRHYELCPATTGAGQLDFTVTDAAGITFTSHFLVVWDTP